MIKKDFNGLGVAIQTFENIVNSIETKSLSFLEQNKLDSVLFGANTTPTQGQIEVSARVHSKIAEDVKVVAFNDIVPFLNTKTLEKRYFDREKLVLVPENFPITNLGPNCSTTKYKSINNGFKEIYFRLSGDWGPINYITAFNNITGKRQTIVVYHTSYNTSKGGPRGDLAIYNSEAKLIENTYVGYGSARWKGIKQADKIWTLVQVNDTLGIKLPTGEIYIFGSDAGLAPCNISHFSDFKLQYTNYRTSNSYCYSSGLYFGITYS